MGTLANAIATLEGYGVAGAIPTVANNPGNLELGDVGYGTIQAQGGNNITVFGSASDGWSALNNQIASIYNGNSQYYNPSQTLQQFGNTYSGGNTSYGQNLANLLGVSPNTTLGNLQQANAIASQGNSVSSPSANAIASNQGTSSPSNTGFNLLDPSTWGGAAGIAGATGGPGGGSTWWGSLLEWLSPQGGKTSSTSFIARVAIGVIGLILITAGLYAFKQTQGLVVGATRLVKKGAAIAAE